MWGSIFSSRNLRVVQSVSLDILEHFMLLITDADFGAYANLLLCFVDGRWNQFGKSVYAKDSLAQCPQQ
jgi:hypothetical protein